jgi:tetratricopeptide (TPR) repeat protein
MRTGTSLLVIFLMLMMSGGFARAENWLQGQVLEQHGGTKRPATGAQIWIVNVGNPYLTQSDGGYRVLVPDAIRIGQTIALYVKRKGWSIATPLAGKVELSPELTSDIVLAPETSAEFLSPAQIDNLLESLPEKLKQQITPKGKDAAIDPTQVVKEYAATHGLPEQEVRAKIETLVRQYEQSADRGKQCLAAIYHKQLKQAATCRQQNTLGKLDVLKKKSQEVEALSRTIQKTESSKEPPVAGRFLTVLDVLAEPSLVLWTDSRYGRPGPFLASEPPTTTAGSAQLEEAKRQLVQLTEDVVEDFRLAGHAYYANYEFDQALAAYQEGLRYVPKQEMPTLWATLMIDIGNTQRHIAARSEEEALHHNLRAAAVALRDACTVYSKKDFPELWAKIQHNLGNALQADGEHTSGPEGAKLLREADEAYRKAQSVSPMQTP